MLVVVIGLISTSVTAEQLKKEDFQNLEGKDRVFYLTTIEFAYALDDFKDSFKQELGEIITSLDSKLAESFPVEKLKESVEKELGVTLNTKAFDLRFSDRENQEFFAKKPGKTEQYTYYQWNVPSRNNQLVVSVYVYKLGDRIKLNKAQIELRFLVLNKDKTAYEPHFYSTDRLSWNKPEDIYPLITENCIIK